MGGMTTRIVWVSGKLYKPGKFSNQREQRRPAEDLLDIHDRERERERPPPPVNLSINGSKGLEWIYKLNG